MSPGCRDHQFAKNQNCRRCNERNPNDGGGGASAEEELQTTYEEEMIIDKAECDKGFGTITCWN